MLRLTVGELGEQIELLGGPSLGGGLRGPERSFGLAQAGFGLGCVLLPELAPSLLRLRLVRSSCSRAASASW